MAECGREYLRRKPETSVLYQAVREGWQEVSARHALPRRIREEVRKYLECGDLRRGFAHVRCASCRESMVVAFSCKSRFCPSCAARRAEETAAHCGELSPPLHYRQWTLSLPRTLRWAVVRRPKLLKRVEKAVWRSLRQEARRLGAEGRLEGGAVAQAQWFGSALQLKDQTRYLTLLPPWFCWNSSC